MSATLIDGTDASFDGTMSRTGSTRQDTSGWSPRWPTGSGVCAADTAQSFEAARPALGTTAQSVGGDPDSACCDVSGPGGGADELHSYTERLEVETRAKDERLDSLTRHIEALNFAISHDLRQPLRSAHGFVELLSEELNGPLDAPTRRYLGRIRAAAVRMDAMLDGLLALSRLNIAPMMSERVNLGALAQEIAADLRQEHRRRSVELYVDDNMHVTGDPRMLCTLLENLLDNAWKFSAVRDTAQIRVGKSEDGAGSYVYFVSDNGAGLDNAWRGKLFKPFHRLHADHEFAGHGIGLALAACVVERHGGRIWIEGTSDGGAIVRFTLG